MKKFINLIPAICLTAWLGCGGGGGDTKSKGVIAYSPLTLSNPFFKVIGDHIKAEAEKNGYTVRIVDPNMDVKKQSDQMDDFISSGVTAIILVPCDRLSVGPSVQAANKAGIPVFTVDAKCAAENAKIEGHVGTDNFQGGELAGKAMITALGDAGGKVLVLDFKKANSCVLRVGGFKKVIDTHNKTATGKIEIVSELDGNGDRTKGYQSTADALQAHEDLDAIFAINDPSALGAYTAVKEAKRDDKIKIIGFDGQLDGKQAIKDGKLYADPIQHPDKMGRQ
ncbi:MAG: substrate-binding domain-containing protein, partial [Limisphaerales bacterium]